MSLPSLFILILLEPYGSLFAVRPACRQPPPTSAKERVSRKRVTASKVGLPLFEPAMLHCFGERKHRTDENAEPSIGSDISVSRGPTLTAGTQAARLCMRTRTQSRLLAPLTGTYSEISKAQK